MGKTVAAGFLLVSPASRDGYGTSRAGSNWLLGFRGPRQAVQAGGEPENKCRRNGREAEPCRFRRAVYSAFDVPDGTPSWGPEAEGGGPLNAATEDVAQPLGEARQVQCCLSTKLTRI